MHHILWAHGLWVLAHSQVQQQQKRFSQHPSEARLPLLLPPTLQCTPPWHGDVSTRNLGRIEHKVCLRRMQSYFLLRLHLEELETPCWSCLWLPMICKHVAAISQITTATQIVAALQTNSTWRQQLSLARSLSPPHTHTPLPNHDTTLHSPKLFTQVWSQRHPD